jgi:hypothetical protein
MLLTLAAGLAYAQCTFGAASYDAHMKFADKSNGWTQMSIWFDGTNYFVPNGGSSPMPMEIYDVAGSWLTDRSVGMDFRGAFGKHDGTNTTYFRGYSSKDIRKRTPGVGGSLHTTLSGGSLDAQSNVVWDPSEGTFIANTNGTVNCWDDAGAFVGFVPLSGIDTAYPQGRGIATTPDGCWYTYANGTITSWDKATGTALDTATLNLAGNSFDSHFSFSYTNGHFWVLDFQGGTWRGYPVGP